METSEKIIALTIMYGLPLFLAIMYRINKNRKTKLNMITENDVLNILGEKFPEINSELEKTSGSENIYKTLQCFANYTKRCAKTGNIKKLKSCFLIADKLISKGNNKVKSAVRNVYLISVSSLIEIVSPIQEQVKKMLPENLMTAYEKQIMASNP
jgi:hypothetical protein